MKCWKKVTAALMAALALVGMTGCAKPSPGQLITGAQQRMAKVNSMRMSMDIKLELAEELSAVGLSMTMDADIIQKPEAKTKASPVSYTHLPSPQAPEEPAPVLSPSVPQGE